MFIQKLLRIHKTEWWLKQSISKNSKHHKGHSVTYDKNIMFFYIYFETTCDFHFKETYMIQLMINLHLDLCWIDEMYMNPILFV